MGCPQCDSDEISSTGVCLVCGYAVVPQNPPPEMETQTAAFTGAIRIDYSEGETQQESERPDWKQELSQRLNAIKQKKAQASSPDDTSASPPVQKQREDVSILQAKLLEKMPPRKPRTPSPPAPRQIQLQPIPEEKPHPEDSPDEIRRLIDNAVSLRPAQAEDMLDIEIPSARPSFNHEGKLILLSRTLSGLIDFILILLCTGVFLLAADYFARIVELDNVSLVNLSSLFILNYFVYSLFFLAASNQTVGMMITDLRVVGNGNTRPSVLQLFGRCCIFLASVFGLGIGLLVGLFDRENRCLHDRRSGTNVVRI